jgi:hypothetical protein
MSKKIVFDPKLLNPRNTSLKKKPTFKRSESSSITKLRKKILKQINNNAKPAPIKQPPKIKKPDDQTINGTINFLNNKLPMERKPNISQVVKKPLFTGTQPKTSPKAPFKSKISFEHVNLDLPSELQEPTIRISGNNGKTRKNNEPTYGCLKRGNKPTYKKSTTRRNIVFNTENNNIHEFDKTTPPTMNINIDERTLSSPPPNLNVTPMASPASTISPQTPENISLDVEELQSEIPTDKVIEAKMDEVNILDIIPENELVNDIKNNVPTNKVKKTGRVTQKMKLGKIGKKVSVLINDNTTRKNIRNEKHLLNITPIKKVKEYLKQNNLLEVGSTAPDDVLRSIYTNAKLSGELENKNGDILLNNYMKGEEDDNS